MARDITDAAILILIVLLIVAFFGSYMPLHWAPTSYSVRTFYPVSSSASQSSSNAYSQTTVTRTVETQSPAY